MHFESINPYNGEVIGSYEAQDSATIKQVLNQAQTAFERWRNSDMKSRAKLMHQAAEVLRKHEADYAQMISSEMGKPIVEARGEVTKCAWVCDFYADNAADFLAQRK
ncbi:MAG: aldehyde dehydrogenase family protein [Owenweeksia sp.]|nr:aldehyde dehydrogenase family protein [Owenweeksia sp.]